ncbi:hypothetical protein [Staphylococcus pseudoxylosus]|nr:hypothetical protein [Staphylococcus pseudoxylosus]
MKVYQKILEILIYTVFAAIILGLAIVILGLLLAGIQSIYTFVF